MEIMGNIILVNSTAGSIPGVLFGFNECRSPSGRGSHGRRRGCYGHPKALERAPSTTDEGHPLVMNAGLLELFLHQPLTL